LIAAALQGASPMAATGVLAPLPKAGVGAEVPKWSRTATMDDMHAVYPANLKGRLAAALTCDLRDDGYVGRCDVVTRYPYDPSVSEAALRLANKFQVPPDYLAAARESGSKLWLQLTLTPRDDDRADFRGDLCPPPFCTGVPLPPPPPPKPSQIPTPEF
jgi:hypothetical protein